MTNLQNDKLKWFFHNYIKQKTKWICFIMVLIFVGISVGNISPLIFGKIIDIMSELNLNKLLNLIILYFIVTVFANFLSILENYVGQIISFKIVKKTQADLFNKIVTLNEKSLRKYETGELISRLDSDAETVVSFFLNIITSIIQIIINLSISVYFVLYISKHLSVVALFYIPASVASNLIVRRYYKKLAQRKKMFSDNYFSFISEIFNNCIPIKAFNLQNKSTDKYKGFIAKEYSILKNSLSLSSIVEFMTTLITVSSSLFIIYYSAILISKGLLTVGLMVSFNTYIDKLFSSISEILSLNIQKQEVEVSVERLTEILWEDSENDDVNNKISDCKSIYLDNISFGYNDEKMILSDLNLSIDGFGFYSLVGKNGCGKSTIAKLLVKLYDADSGYIMVGGTDIKGCSVSSVRDNITYVQKEDFFFDDTIYNNLKLANENSSDYDVENVCKKVGIDDYILSFNDGYYTLMGEGGNNFSTGQKQKLSVARSLLRKSSIYIYDESTANLDGKSEKNIIDLLLQLSEISIVIFISHKAASIVNSDKIFVVDNGYIASFGNHEELMQKCNLYQELFYNSK